jgi:hypothetical protein
VLGMKKILAIALCLSFAAASVLGQGGGVLKRAKELSRQNDVRQGVPPPAKPQPPVAPPSANAPKPTATPQESIAKIQADLAVFKAGTSVTAEQKQQLLKDVAVAMRGKKASLPTVQKAVDSLTAALADGTLQAAERTRLATDIDTIVNSADMAADKFDATVGDVQAILQVGHVKRNLAMTAANDLKAVGAEIRR